MYRLERNRLNIKGVTSLEPRRFLAGAAMAPVDQLGDVQPGLPDAQDASGQTTRVRPERVRPTRVRDERGSVEISTEVDGEALLDPPERSVSEAETPTRRNSGVRPTGEQVYFQDFDDIPEGQPEIDDRREVIELIGENVKYIKGFGADSQVSDDPDQRGREAAGQVNDANDTVRVSFDEGAIRALYPSGGNTSSHSGVQYEDEIVNGDLSEGAIEEAIISYRVKVDDDFPWQSGGKLPGVIAKEGYRTDDTKHSVRLMWREEGKLEFYIHTPDDRDRLFWDNGNDQLGHASLRKGEWQDIDFRVKLNSFEGDKAVADGQLEGWVNGEHAGYFDNVVLRDSPADNINTMFFSTFYGGSSGDGSVQWWPTSDSSALFDDVRVERI